MIRGSIRARGKQVALLCGLGVVAVGSLGVRHAVRHVRESRAIAALESSESFAEWQAALEELGRMRSLRAIPRILRSINANEVIHVYRMSDELHDLPLNLDDPRFEPPGGHEQSSSPREDLGARVILDFGRAAGPHLRASLRSENPDERFWALCLLGRSEMYLPEGAGPDLPLLLDDPEMDVRQEAAIALGMAASTNAGLVDRIIADLERPDASERLGIAAVHALGLAALLAVREVAQGAPAGDGQAGSRPQPTGRYRVASTAVPALIEAARAPSVDVRRASMKGLCAVVRHRQWFGDLDLRKTIQDITERWLVDEDTSTRRLGMKWVQRAFETPGPHATLPRRAFELIACRLSDPDRELRDFAAWMLLDRYQTNSSFVGHVLFDHEDEEVRSKAVETLSWNGTLTVELFQAKVLDLLLAARTDSLRRSACKAAEVLGPEAEKAVPHLISLIERQPWDGQESAVRALGAMGAAAHAAVPALVGLTRRADQKLADEATEALAAISGVQ